MRRRGPSREFSELRTCSGKKTVESCKVNGDVDKVVVIDLEIEDVIDVEKVNGNIDSLQPQSRSSSTLRKDREFESSSVININDDDDDEEDNYVSPVIILEDGGDLDSDATSSKSYFPDSKYRQNSVISNGHECQVVQEKGSKFIGSKCKQTHSGKTSGRNRCGLFFDSESGSSDQTKGSTFKGLKCKKTHSGKTPALNRYWFESESGLSDQEKGSTFMGSKCKQTHSGKNPGANGDGLVSDPNSDYSDCELIESSSEKLHKHWEKASQKRKKVVHNGHSGSGDQVSGSGSRNDTHANAEVDDRTEHAEDPVCSSSNNGNYEKENLPDFMGTRGGHVEGSSFDPQIEANQKVGEESVSAKETEFLHRNDDFQQVRATVTEDPLLDEWQSYPNDGISSFCNDEEQSPEGPSLWSNEEELGRKQSKHTGTCFMDNVQKFRDETCFSDSLPRLNKDQRKGSALNQENFFCKNQHYDEMLIHHDRVEVRDKEGEFHDAPSSCNSSFPNEYRKGAGFEEKGKAVSGQPFDETHGDCGVVPSEDKLGALPGEPVFFSTLYKGKSEISTGKACSQEKVRADSVEVALCNTSCNGARSNQGGFDSERGKKSCDLRNQLQAHDGNASPVQRDVINDREKLKETAEYKRAIEEEMASRQRVLQIQAEEAQRLRKRRKAESMRLLDMQRRQKQRVEEVRETQKKDEENLNLKDQLRAEIRKELDRLELTCIDMASLLRGLGIQVGDGFHPLPHEVHAAYKRALLKFHPDRASRNDIRQQVEAEETFKLISRMKEKLLLTSCF